jgi:hypothetical protein
MGNKKLSLEKMEAFCKVFSEDGTLNFAAYGGASPRQFAKVNLQDIYDELTQLNNEGYDVYFMPNSADGFTADSVNHITAVFFDADCGRIEDYLMDGHGQPVLNEKGKPQTGQNHGNYHPDKYVQQWKRKWKVDFIQKKRDGLIPEPTAIVQTRNGYQGHWVLATGEELTNNQFVALTLSIAEHLKTDASVATVERRMRFPGFQWVKAKEGLPPFQTSLGYLGENRVTIQELLDCFPLSDEHQQIFDATEDIATRRGRKARSYLAGCSDAGQYYIKAQGHPGYTTHAHIEGSELRAGCQLCDDVKGHDIVLNRRDEIGHCFRCGTGYKILRDEKDDYSIKNQQLWDGIQQANSADDLTTDERNYLQSYLDYKGQNTTVEDYFSCKTPPPIEPDIQQDESPVIQIYSHSDLLDEIQRIESQRQFHQDFAQYLEFPIDALPDYMQRYVYEVSNVYLSVPDYTAVPLLISSAATMGRAVVLELTSTYKVYPCFWGCSVGISDSGKSVGSIYGNLFLNEIDDLNNRDYLDAMNEYEQDLVEYQRDMQFYKSRKNHKKPDPLDKPKEKRIRVDNLTIESLYPILQANPKGILLDPDEISNWVNGMGQYTNGKKGNSPEQTTWIRTWDVKPIRVDRKTSGSYYIKKPLVCAYGSIQPEVIHDVFDRRMLSDGFATRILVYYPEQKDSEREYQNLDDRVCCEVRNIFHQLNALEVNVNPSGVWDDFHEEAVVLTIHPDCIQRHKDFSNWIRGLKNQYPFSVPMRNAVSKMVTYYDRFSLLIHYLRYLAGEVQSSNITASSLNKAEKLIRYFIAHAGKVWESGSYEFDQHEGQIIAKVIQWMDKHHKPIKTMNIQNNRWVKTAPEAKAILKKLVDTGQYEYTSETETEIRKKT